MSNKKVSSFLSRIFLARIARKLIPILFLFIACSDTGTGSDPAPLPVGPARVQLIEADSLFADTLFPSVDFSADTSSDTIFNGDSSALLLDSQLTSLTFTILSRDDNLKFMWFNITRVRMLQDGDTVLIIGDYEHMINDGIVALPAKRKYSLNATIHLSKPLGVGNYKFVANVFVSCFCIGVPKYNYTGTFVVRERQMGKRDKGTEGQGLGAES